MRSFGDCCRCREQSMLLEIERLSFLISATRVYSLLPNMEVSADIRICYVRSGVRKECTNLAELSLGCSSSGQFVPQSLRFCLKGQQCFRFICQPVLRLDQSLPYQSKFAICGVTVRGCSCSSNHFVSVVLLPVKVAEVILELAAGFQQSIFPFAKHGLTLSQFIRLDGIQFIQSRFGPPRCCRVLPHPKAIGRTAQIAKGNQESNDDRCESRTRRAQ